MASLYILEAANLFVTDNGPNNSKHLSLQQVKLPTLEEVTAQHHAGGAIGEIEIGGLGVKALVCQFDLVGVDPQTLAQFGLGSQETQPYTIYGLARDKNGGRAIEVKSVLQARLTKAEPDAFKRGDLFKNAYELKEVSHYELYVDQQEIYYWDFFTSDYRVNGNSENTDDKNILRIPGS